MDLDVAGRGATDELSALYREHAVGLTRLAMLMVGDRASAEDVVQDAFLGLHRRHGEIRNDDGGLAYVRSAVLNRCRSVLRRRAVAGRFHQPYEPPVWSAEDGAMADEERRQVLAAIARLPRRLREVLALRYYCDLSESEIARTLNVSRGTVSSTTSRALTALSKLVGGQS
jgi:RNA polymerase sigma-70 factor (sigma-E family)